MAFWSKKILLPDSLYQSVGECFLDGVECRLMASKLDPGSITCNQASELLGFTQQCIARLRSVVVNYPIDIDELRERQDLSVDIDACDEKKTAVLALSEQIGAAPLYTYRGDVNGLDIVHFVRGLLAMETILGIHLEQTGKLMAKGANIRFDEFMSSALGRVKETPRAKSLLGAAASAARQ
jgi:hypothetical protein